MKRLKPRRLARRLALLLSAGLAMVWLAAVLSMAVALKGEEDELYDQQLVVSAEALLPVLSQDHDNDAPPAAETGPRYRPREALVYRLIDSDGHVLRASGSARWVVFPEAITPDAFQRTSTHVIYTTGFDGEGRAMQFADPLAERREAWRAGFLGFMLPMLALLPIGYLVVGWITTAALRPLEDLRAEMGRRDGADLAPVDSSAHPAELARIVEALNGFMARLAQALEGERAFATNAAHELRTPIAVALAQVQRLREEVAEPALVARVEAVEGALRRMVRLVTRLLQLARAEAGLGPGLVPVDAAKLMPHIVEGIEAGRDRLRLVLPDGPVTTRMDGDAIAIVAGNLIENALRHSPAGSEVEVRLGADGRLGVTNAGPVVGPEALARLTARFERHQSGGFGLGLHISQQIARQAGADLALYSPASGRADGFEAVLTLT